MITTHIYRSPDPEESNPPFGVYELIAPIPAWLARRRLSVWIDVKGFDFSYDGSTYVFAKKTRTTDWLWTGETPPDYTYSTFTESSQYEDSTGTIRGYRITVRASGVGPDLKDDDVTEVVATPSGGGWSPSFPFVGSFDSETVTVVPTGGGFEVTTETVFDNATRTVVVTYSEPVLPDDIEAAMVEETGADWDDTQATGWSEVPQYEYIIATSLYYNVSNWTLPAELTTSSTVSASVTRIVGLGVRKDPQVWLRVDTTTGGPSPIYTETPTVFEPETPITTDDILGFSGRPEEVRLQQFDTQNPPQILRSSDDELVYDVYVDQGLGVGDDYQIDMRLYRTWRSSPNYSHYYGVYTYINPAS